MHPPSAAARRHRRRLLAMAVVVVLSVLVVASPAGAEAEDFRLRALVVDATLGRDGSLEVRERITYDFDGSFTAGIRSFPPMARGRIEGFRASEDGRTLPVVPPSSSISGEWEWGFVALDEERTFELAYRIEDLAAVGPDVAELYWKILQFEGVVERTRVTIHLPTATGVRAWGHGPPSGQVAIDGDTVVLTTGRVGAGRLVEARVVVPATALDVPPSGGPRLPGILEEEARWAQERRDEQRRSDLANRAAVPVAIGAVLAFVAVWLRWGKEPTPPDDVGDYWREPLGDPPAIVMGTRAFGSVPATAFSATVVDLAQRGYLTITEERTERLGPDKTDYHFRQRRPPDEEADGDLLPWERSLLRQLFAAGPTTTMGEFTQWGREHPGEAQQFWKGWQGAVRKDLRARHYIEPNRPLPFVLGALVALGAIGTGVATFALGTVVERVNVLALVPLASGLVLLPCLVVMRRRTTLGARRAAEADALRRFLRDFSSLDEAPVASLVMWERFLVYAVALGVSKELVAALAVRVPEVASATGAGSFATWYTVGALGGMGRGGGPSFAGLGSFVADFGSGTSSAFTPSSSGSGAASPAAGAGASAAAASVPAEAPDHRSEPAPRPPPVDLTDVAPSALPLALATLHHTTGVGAEVLLRLPPPVVLPARRRADVVVGAGFVRRPRRHADLPGTSRVRRVRSLPDTVGPGMGLLVCGLNPSLLAADVGVGFVRGGNRFWPAARAVGVVSVDRDPLHALSHHGVGMTDLAKRATARADELTAAEYVAGLERVERLAAWLAPAVVLFVGLDGWRRGRRRQATTGWQPEQLGGRPLYVMPSTSGLNARVGLAALTDHLRAAADGPGGPG